MLVNLTIARQARVLGTRDSERTAILANRAACGIRCTVTYANTPHIPCQV
jgi:hypothetical protein